MAKTKEQKKKEIEKIADSFKEAKAVVFTSYDGLSVADSQALRNQLRKEDVTYVAGKKTLLKRAMAASEAKDIDLDSFAGSLGLAFGRSDEVAPAKIVAKFAKGNQHLRIHGGILEGMFITAEKVMELAKLPSRDELLAKTVHTIKAPISGLVNVLSGNLRGLVNVLNALKNK